MTEYAQSSANLPVLLVDDEIRALESYELQMIGEGFDNSIRCQSGEAALKVLEDQDVSLILLDLRMPGLSGEEVLLHVVSHHPDVPVVVITGMNDVETAVTCMKKGAFDFIVKPVDPERLITTVKRAMEFRDLKLENIILKDRILNKTIKHPEAFSHIITNSEKMIALFNYIESIAGTSQPVLITGETGVGKELVAKALHNLSGLSGALVSVNVAGVDDTVFADTLFGHKPGAYTGADRVRGGLVEKAEKGTLFLDEIGDISQSSQVKLLRLLQEKEYYALGSDSTRKSTARVVVSTNQDLDVLMADKRFRPDLFYRLMQHHISIPPLRERREDIPLLVQHFVEQSASELGKETPAIHAELYDLLSVYDFPGNIRELQALIFDAVSRHEMGEMGHEKILDKIKNHLPEDWKESRVETADIRTALSSLDRLPTIGESENCLMQEALKRTNGNRSSAALMLGVSRQTLFRWLQTQKE